VNAVSASDTLGRCVSGSDDRSVRLWDVATGGVVRVLRGHHGEVTAVVLLDTSVVSGSQDESVCQWSLDTGECIRTMWGHSKGITSLCATANFSHVFSGGDDFTVRVWEVTTGDCVHVFENHTEEVTCVCATEGGERIVSGGRDGRVCICDAVVAAADDNAQEEANVDTEASQTIASLAKLVKAERSTHSAVRAESSVTIP